LADPHLGLAGIVITSTFLVVGDDIMKFKALSSGCLSLIFAVYFTALGQAHAEIVTFYGNLDSAQVVDEFGNRTSNSTATGEGSVTVDTDLLTIRADLVWRGLSGPSYMSHEHYAPAGVNALNMQNQFIHEIIGDMALRAVGGMVDCPYINDPTLILHACAPATGELHDTLDLVGPGYSYFDPNGVFGFTDIGSMVAALESGSIYLDMHTNLFPVGEIRGQLINQSVPEPSTLYLLGVGIFAALCVQRKLVH
jgi:hypothetical protein